MLERITETLGKCEVELLVVSPENFAMFMYQDVQTTTHFYLSMVDGVIFSVKSKKFVTFNPNEYNNVIEAFKRVMLRLYT